MALEEDTRREEGEAGSRELSRLTVGAWVINRAYREVSIAQILIKKKGLLNFF